MTAAEWLEFSTSSASNSYATFAMIITMASGYLAAAYLVGEKITRSQVVLINLVFVPTMLFFSGNAYGALEDALIARIQATAMLSEFGAMSSAQGRFYILAAAFVYLSILTICLKFMWDVRHPKNN